MKKLELVIFIEGIIFFLGVVVWIVELLVFAIGKTQLWVPMMIGNIVFFGHYLFSKFLVKNIDKLEKLLDDKKVDTDETGNNI